MTGVTEAFLTTILGGAVFLALVCCFPQLLGLIHGWLETLEPKHCEGQPAPERKIGIGRAEIIIAAMCLVFGIACEAACDFLYEKSGLQGWAAVEALKSGNTLSPIGAQLRDHASPMMTSSISEDDAKAIEFELNSPDRVSYRYAQIVYYTAKNWFVIHAEGAPEINWMRRRLILERSIAIAFLVIALTRLGFFIWMAASAKQCKLEGVRAAAISLLIGLAMSFSIATRKSTIIRQFLGRLPRRR